MTYPRAWLTDPDPAPPPGCADAVLTYVSETNKTANAWSRVPDDQLGYTPHAQSNTIRQIFAHQILSERRFFAEFLGLNEPPADGLLPPGHGGPDHQAPGVRAYIDRYVALARPRIARLTAAGPAWWHHPTRFFDVKRTRHWVFWRRVLHTAHHRTQVLVYLRLMGAPVPATYGPSGDETWDGADPTLPPPA